MWVSGFRTVGVWGSGYQGLHQLLKLLHQLPQPTVRTTAANTCIMGLARTLEIDGGAPTSDAPTVPIVFTNHVALHPSYSIRSTGKSREVLRLVR